MCRQGLKHQPKQIRQLGQPYKTVRANAYVENAKSERKKEAK